MEGKLSLSGVAVMSVGSECLAPRDFGLCARFQIVVSLLI